LPSGRILTTRDKTWLVIERHVRTPTHGRYLVRPPNRRDAAPILVGFHGYAESADVQLDRLRAIPGSERWCVVSIQGLHRFYQSRTNDVVASWMTRQDRELAIADNVAYVSAVLDAVSVEYQTQAPVVFAGFSQGVAMAFRAAAAVARRPAGVIAVGGDVPPELGPDTLGTLSAALICRGAGDAVYLATQFASDIRRLQESGVRVHPLEFDGAHEWSYAVTGAAALFLGDAMSIREQ
jgi:poly(3-hydroxybutyrate) depolymerase